MKALVTGGQGFIGGHLVDALLSDGVKVLVMDNQSNSSHETFYTNKEAKYYRVSAFDHKGCRDFFQENQDLDYVYHLAAESRIPVCNEDPANSYVNNVVSVCNMLQYSKWLNIKRFIFSSSCAVYDLSNQPPLEESMSTGVLNPYAASKIAGEELCQMYYKLYEVPTVTLRYFNVYGPRAPKKAAEAPVVSKLIEQRKTNTRLSVMGNGEQTRDFIHVDDVVRANILAATCDSSKVNGEIFNVGTGKETSINELIRMIHSSPKYDWYPARRGECSRSLANINKIKKILKWEPEKSLKLFVEKELDILD